MKGYYRKLETAHPAGTLLLLFSLFASISLTPSEYPDFTSLFPDANLEIFGICEVSQKQFPSPHGTKLTAISSAPKGSLSWEHFLAAFPYQPTKSQTVLEIIFRCQIDLRSPYPHMQYKASKPPS